MEAAEHNFFLAGAHDLVFLLVEFDCEDDRFGTLAEGNQGAFRDIVDCDLVLFIHGRGSNVSAAFGYGHIVDVPLQLLGKNGLGFQTIGVPDDQAGPSSQLPRSHQSFRGIDVQADNIVIVGSVDSHRVFVLVEHYPAGRSMVHDFTLRVVSYIVSGIVTSVAVDVADIQVHVGRFVFGGFLARSEGVHLVADLGPGVGSLELLALLLLGLELIGLFCQLVVEDLLLGLFGGLSSKAECLHPEPAMIVVFEHGLKLVEADLFIVVVVVLLELGGANLSCVFLSDQVERFEVFEDCAVELAEALLVHFAAARVDLEDELAGLGVVLVQGGRRAHELVEVHRTVALKIDVVEYVFSLLE